MKFFINSITLFLLFGVISCIDYSDPYKNNLGIPSYRIAQLDIKNYTEIAWLDSVQYLGQTPPQDNISVVFHFKNIGNKPLFIYPATCSCGCTILKYSHALIKKGAIDSVLVIFNACNYLNCFVHKTITVTTNTKNKPQHTLEFTAYINKKLN
jgi:hypothetical protein